MRHEHRAGERMFVDYPGATLPIVDPATSEISPAQLFVAVLGDTSSYTYAEATRSQALADWIGAHVNAFEFYEGAPAVVVPDYVPGNTVVLLWPTWLCGDRLVTSGP